MTPAQLLVKGAITHVQHKAQGGEGGFRYKGLRFGGRGDESKVDVTIYIVDSTTGRSLLVKEPAEPASPRARTVDSETPTRVV